MQSDYDNSLQSYFTDMESPRAMFMEYVSAEKLSKRLIVFHGVGGVGKSSLLRMFRMHCKSERIPVALTSGDDAKSVLDVVTRWTEDLKEDGIKFPALSKTLDSYRTIQAKVEDQARKSQNKVADIASKAVSKTAETAGGALLGAAIGSVIPGVGTAIGGALGGVVSGMGAEALTDWLRGFLSKPDIDLLLDPTKKLSTDFLEDIAKVADKKRIVLLLDTLEQMVALDDWVGETAQKIHPNVLMVIVGRKLPDWNRAWPGWMMNAQVEELKPMAEGVMRELIHRYYATMRGGEPDPIQEEAIIRFAQGLPMVVTSAVQLWVKYGVEDFQLVKAEIVANLVDRLMEGVPSALLPALEAAAVVRWFDQPILRAVIMQDDVRDVYNELRRFPFVRTRVEGLALHDSVREMMNENLRVQDSERHAELHKRAAIFYEGKLKALQMPSDDLWKFTYEKIYHHVRADENIGLEFFKQVFEQAQIQNPISRHILLMDAKADSQFSLRKIDWIKYYEARVTDNIDQRIIEYRKLANRPGLKLHANTSLGIAYFSKGEIDLAITELEKNLTFVQPETYNKLSLADQTMAAVSRRYLRSLYRIIGRFVDSINLPISNDNPRELFEVARSLFFLGRYEEAVRQYLLYLEISQQVGTPTRYQVRARRHLGHVYQSQGRNDMAREEFERSKTMAEEINDVFQVEAARSNLVFLAQDINGLEKCVSSMTEMLTTFPQEQTTAYWYLIELGKLYIEYGEHAKGCQIYQQALDLSKKSSYAVGIMRSMLGLCNNDCLKNHQAIHSLLSEAEQFAQQYEYNDYLAAVRLTQGHLAWENGSQDEALAFYQKAMIYALRYNRFMLDELINGHPQGTPLRPLAPFLLERGESGKKTLSALCDWWKTGINDIGTQRPNTISSIPEGIPLLEAEKLAREREPGDGSMQRMVVQQIEAVINP